MTKAQLIRRHDNRVLLPMFLPFIPVAVLLLDMMFQFTDFDSWWYSTFLLLLILGVIASFVIARTVRCPDCHHNLYFAIRSLPWMTEKEKIERQRAEVLGGLAIKFCPYCGTDLTVEE